MRIRINGKDQEVTEARTIKDLVEMKGLDASKIVIEHNHNIVPGEDIAGIMLSENDAVEILSFVGGG